jgi:hypothetical protein
MTVADLLRKERFQWEEWPKSPTLKQCLSKLVVDFWRNAPYGLLMLHVLRNFNLEGSDELNATRRNTARLCAIRFASLAHAFLPDYKYLVEAETACQNFLKVNPGSLTSGCYLFARDYGEAMKGRRRSWSANNRNDVRRFGLTHSMMQLADRADSGDVARYAFIVAADYLEWVKAAGKPQDMRFHQSRGLLRKAVSAELADIVREQLPDVRAFVIQHGLNL